MMAIREEQLKLAGEKYRNVYQLLRASVNKTTDFDSGKCYSADELEPYDALSDRFIRTVEVAIKFFRTYEIICGPNKAKPYGTACIRWKN